MVSALGRMRRPTATTVSAPSTSAPAPKPAERALCWAVSALRSARRWASLRGSSPFSGVSSTWAGTRCSGSMPIWLSRASRRGEAEARIRSGRLAMRSNSVEGLGPSPGSGRSFAQNDPLNRFVRPSGGRAKLFEAVGDAALGEVIGRHFAQDLVTGEDANAILAHATGGVGDDLMVVLQLDPKGRVGKQFHYHAREFEHFFLCHTVSR